jgi:prolipoprotein diacylglyceryltransferase
MQAGPPQGSPSLASYENYKMDMLKSSQKGDETNKASYVPDDQTLRIMYEAARTDKIQSAKHISNKSIIVSSILIFICLILFVTHWGWMRKYSKLEVS